MASKQTIFSFSSFFVPHATIKKTNKTNKNIESNYGTTTQLLYGVFCDKVL